MGNSSKQKPKQPIKEKSESGNESPNSYIQTSISSIKELLCPFHLELKNLNYIKFQSRVSRYAKTFFVNTLPRFLKFGDFLKPLYNFGNTNTSIFIYPIPESTCQTNLNEIISQINGEILESSDEEDRNKLALLFGRKVEAENLRDENLQSSIGFLK
jgi:hypothetical protein